MKTVQMLRDALHGLIAAPVTPFRADYSLDIEAISANVQFLVERDVRLFVPCGSIGEFASLTLAERKTVLEETVKAVGSRGHVVANISGTDRESIVDLARHAAAAGAAGTMILPPFYHRPSGEELVEFLRWVDGVIDLPFVLYNNPGTANVNISMEGLEALAGLPKFAALKEANPDIVRFHQVFRRFDARFPVIAATETPVAFFLLSGAKAVMTATIDYAPEFMRRLLDAASAGDIGRTWELYDGLLAVRDLLEPLLRQGYPAYIPFTKAAVEVRGLRAGPPRPPLRPVEPAMRRRFEEAVQTHLLPESPRPARSR